jgi:hypothetical protein
MERKPRVSSISVTGMPAVRLDEVSAPSTAGRSGAEGLVEDIKTARRDLLSARHPAYHRLLGVVMALAGDAGDSLGARFERAWRTRTFPTFYERPLLILAALRADALQEGKSHPLHAAIAATTPDPDVITVETVAASLGRERLGVWSTMTTRRVQTNDTSRAVTWLWPAHIAGCDGGQRRVALVDIGASAGLNLVADRLPAIWSDAATRSPIPCAAKIDAVVRMGFDTRPLDIKSSDDVLWMRSCIWPGETARLARFEASVHAMRAAAASPSGPSIERLTASLVPERLEALAASMAPGTLLLAYHTLVSGYLEPAERESYRKGMIALLSRRPAGSTVWAELELDDARRRLPAVLTVHARERASVRSLRLGRSSQHPGEIEVDGVAVEELGRLFPAA